jgi:hypothetical protein
MSFGLDEGTCFVHKGQSHLSAVVILPFVFVCYIWKEMDWGNLAGKVGALSPGCPALFFVSLFLWSWGLNSGTRGCYMLLALHPQPLPWPLMLK